MGQYNGYQCICTQKDRMTDTVVSLPKRAIRQRPRATSRFLDAGCQAGDLRYAVASNYQAHSRAHVRARISIRGSSALVVLRSTVNGQFSNPPMSTMSEIIAVGDLLAHTVARETRRSTARRICNTRRRESVWRAVHLHVNAGVELQGVDIGKERVEKIIAEASSLPSIESPPAVEILERRRQDLDFLSARFRSSCFATSHRPLLRGCESPHPKQRRSPLRFLGDRGPRIVGRARAADAAAARRFP